MLILTQIEVVAGYNYGLNRTARPTYMKIVSADNGEGIIAFEKIEGLDENQVLNSSPQYGSVASFNRFQAIRNWFLELNGPIQDVFPIIDANNDGIQDYLVCYATAEPDYYLDNGHYKINFTKHMYGVQLLDGKTGKFISLDIGDNANYTHDKIEHVQFFSNISDDKEDFICAQFDIDTGTTNITGFFINGSIKQTLNLSHFDLKGTSLFPFGGENHLLIIAYNDSDYKTYCTLRNISDYSQVLYNGLIDYDIYKYCIIGDLNGDSVPEYILSKNNGELFLINGSGGNLLLGTLDFFESDQYVQAIELIYNGIGYSDIILKIEASQDYFLTRSIRITSTSFSLNWIEPTYSYFNDLMVLNDDINLDGYPDLILHQQFQSAGSTQQINQFRIISGIDKSQIGIINLNQGPSSDDRFVSINDINGDGKRDIAVSVHDGFLVFSSSKPMGIWLNTSTPWGFILFILCISIIAFGAILLAIKLKKGEMKFNFKEGIKGNKITIIVCTAIIIVMLLIFLLFSISMNVFNSTILQHDANSTVTLTFLSTMLLWFACLPLTAAIYNIIAPYGSYIFIKIRNALFKLSRNVDHDIIVIDIDPKLKLGIIQSLRRCILPILLSITVGLFIYNTFAQSLGYPMTFTDFGGTGFLKFMTGYMLLGMIPMVMSFFIFFFLIPASWLLDDAGIGYYVSNNKKDHIPGDIERLSVWQTSFITGFASFSSLITFYNFMISIDLSGFFTSEDMIMVIFGGLISVVAFWGLPFFTGISFMLLSISVMEGTLPDNKIKLYNLMEKGGFDITPRNITRLYPEGYEKTKKNIEPSNNPVET
ncbi:MAG: hypothetical protein EAX96_18430 [Candidatus Lokiarchaeota archaeon]|nr:hypothetical protein [Candidatus Lokiarchaeota archaeon]